MSAQDTQDFKNHRQYVVGYHYVASFFILANLAYAVFVLITNFSASSVFGTAGAVGLALAAYYAREFPIGNQNRIIRLEERLRLSRLLPDDLKNRIESLSTEQLVALRFASDAELPELARKVIAESISSGEAIKKLIKVWRPDHHRI